MLDTSLRQVGFWPKKSCRRPIQLLGSRFYLNPDSDTRRDILVAGTAPSGTTRPVDLIAFQIPSRILFEPFHLVADYRRLQYFQYKQPGTENPEFYAFAERVSTGEICNRRTKRKGY